jgi:AraC-like DNA-binding protein/predicted transcriptional regulator YdeE
MREVGLMEQNLQSIAGVVDFIEEHLDEELSLESLACEAGYSRYHLHRMFTGIVGMPVHVYVQRRRLTEAARLLIFSTQPVLDIALFAGYDSQQAFTAAFKAMFHRSPQAFRKKRDFHPLQLRFSVDGRQTLRGDRAMDIQIMDCGEIYLVGYSADTAKGFFPIGQCWRKLHANLKKIDNRADPETLIGLNDYAADGSLPCCKPSFVHYAAAEVTGAGHTPAGMHGKTLPAGKYVVFHFSGKAKDSLEPVAAYIYGTWFAQSTCRLNENAPYDFARYGLAEDANGKSTITYWVPVL